MNDDALQDLNSYKKKTLWSSSVLITTLVIAALITYAIDAHATFIFVLGALMGATCATLNVFAIGYAFFIIAIKEGKKLVLLWPLISFIAICILAFLLAKTWPAYLLGFAVGLTSPIFFGIVIVMLS